MFRSERRSCYENYKDYPERRKRIQLFWIQRGKSRLHVDLYFLKKESRQGWEGGMKLALIVTKLTGNAENDRMRAAEYCRNAAHKG